ncbi:putative membrane transporter protein [Azospirillaceae bacterium]
MQIYLPIAEMSVNALVLLGMGSVIGFLSGMFGVGGGFLLTPFLIFIGIPPAVAVGTQANQLLAASVSGVLAHWRRGNVDVHLGAVMLVGGALGSLLGVVLFNVLQRLGQIDLVISLCYVFLLGTIGLMMFVESIKTIYRGRLGVVPRKTQRLSRWRHLPFKMRFQRSKLYISALTPGGIGFVGGVLVAVMGIGGGFLLVPAMIYILEMPIALVAGTSLFQIAFTTAVTTVLQAVTNRTVDFVLALLLVIGSVIGAQLGSQAAGRLRPEVARALLALLVLMVVVKLAIDLVATPEERYAISTSLS